MNMKKYTALIAVILFCVFCLVTVILASDKLTIYTVNYPLRYFAEVIGGDNVDVVFPAPADVDPAYWMPDRQTIANYQKADLILLNGAYYAKWVEKVSLPRSKMVDTSGAFKDRYIRTKAAVTHSHGPEGKHAHEDVAFTVWLDLTLAVKQAKKIEQALSRKRPSLKSVFQQNYEALEKNLVTIDEKIRKIVSQDRSKPLVISHPVYDYLSHRYNMNIKSVHWEPDEMPGMAQWMELRRILKSHPAQWMIWEGQPRSATREKLKLKGIESVVFDPCGNVPDHGDFLSVMRKNVENLELIYK